MPKTTVVDSIMGSGKTTAMIQKINLDPDGSYIYVTPFLPEVDRIVVGTHFSLRQPFQRGDGKLDNLHLLLADGQNIATTHALFLRATAETIDLIHQGGYTLILDEALDVFRSYNDVVKELDNKTVNKADVRWLRENGFISVEDNYRATWHGSTAEDFHFSEVERLARCGALHCVDDVLYWMYPPEIFNAFEEIYALSYLFEGTTFDAYMKMHGLTYEKASVQKNDSGTYELCPYSDNAEYRRTLAPLINIYEGELNRIGARQTAFSVSWLTNKDSDGIKEIRRVMRNYRDFVKAKRASEIMWTTAKKDGKGHSFSEKLEIKGFKYIRRLSADEKHLPEQELRKLRCFVPCNAKATNDFSDRTTLLYLLNRYINPEIQKYFTQQGYPIDEEQFATSELIQWIWRSAIRNGERINLFLPSSRMRRLLYRWLGVDPPNVPRSEWVLKKPQ